MSNFQVIGESSYYSGKKNKTSNEFVAEVNLRFRISFFLAGKVIFAYYMGRYYKGTLLEGSEEIDIYNAILEQCSDPYKVAEEID